MVPNDGDIHGKQCVLVQVVEVLTDSLTLPETPVPSKAARLLLVSDVLHNRCLGVLDHACWVLSFLPEEASAG